MSKLSDTQLVVLTAACQRHGGRVLPLTSTLKGAAITKVVKSLINHGLVETIPAQPGDQVWEEDDAQALTLRVTSAAYEALGIEAPESEALAPMPAAEQKCRPGKAKLDQQGESTTGDAAEPSPKQPTVRAGTKQTLLIEMLRRPDGATLEEIVAATSWQAHTVRGAMAGALKKRLGLDVTSEKIEGRGRVYSPG